MMGRYLRREVELVLRGGEGEEKVSREVERRCVTWERLRDQV